MTGCPSRPPWPPRQPASHLPLVLLPLQEFSAEPHSKTGPRPPCPAPRAQRQCGATGAPRSSAGHTQGWPEATDLHPSVPCSTSHPQSGNTNRWQEHQSAARARNRTLFSREEGRRCGHGDSPTQNEGGARPRRQSGRTPGGGGAPKEPRRPSAGLLSCPVPPRTKPHRPLPRDGLHPRPGPLPELRPGSPRPSGNRAAPLTSSRSRHLAPAPPAQSAAIPAASRPRAARVPSAIFASDLEGARQRRFSRLDSEPRPRPD